ncbi:PaaI family thioesterase [Actinoallomurus sp. CA-150999]|uniref:PaaI family thioesterase n=1 Tax=Actinoallomurus sp. CA-150999 TaxID=3239887 RepID=UPI003D9249E7
MEDQTQQEQASPEIQKRIRASFDRQGLMGHLGARISRIAPGRVQIVLPSRPEVTQQHGYFHAGATSAIADSAGGYAAFTLFPENTDVLTVEYKINLLAPAVGDHLEAIGTVVKSGRTLTVCRLEVFGVQDGERSLVANGQQTLIRINGREQ